MDTLLCSSCDIKMTELSISGNFPASVSIFEDRRLFFQKFNGSEVCDHKKCCYCREMGVLEVSVCFLWNGKKSEILDFPSTDKF